MADRGYVQEQPATQCEGTCARDCNYLISAVVTKPGRTAKGRCYRSAKGLNILLQISSQQPLFCKGKREVLQAMSKWSINNMENGS